MEGHHHRQQRQHQFQLQQQQQLHQPPQQHPSTISVNVDAGDRFPQWSVQETQDLLLIRAELDRTFMETKRNKLLWEVIATKMKEKGHHRSAEQCKCKWKNLITRYKGCETMEPEAMRQQFPFYNELHAIFDARMQRMLWAEETGVASGSKKKALSSDFEDDNDDSEAENKGSTAKNKKKKVKMSNIGSASGNNAREILEEFMKQQLQMEMQWREEFQARENERRLKEIEWRQTMEALENERIMMEARWREREEQRKMREEARAEKRDALITALLNKLN